MQIWPDCIPCITNMSLEIARLALKEEDQIKEFMSQVLRLNYFKGENWKVTSPEVIKEIWSKLVEISGNTDPFKEIKNDQNKKALAIYPMAREAVFKSEDPLLEAIRLAIAGNSMDAMTEVKGGAPEKIIEKSRRLEINRGELKVFKERLGNTRALVYLGDNCGEIVFDRLLIEALLEMYRLEITFVTRTLPILNDATLEDALSTGMGNVAYVMDNGCPEPFAGTFLKGVSPESRRMIENSDLVLSKGGGNHDTLTEEQGLKGKVSFLFMAKCYPFCKVHHVSLGDAILYNF